ncbi:unnamed protein product [Didymodactylos carnosus]|uniref:Fucosyltransferase n=1 Tax=Didymodactylos carnosus TaxID=1234261 RepID=A0A814LQG9_9BILA|nr:unnamed protein product [Didymodactylos carnosus]CAF3834484.1 unnamed protein product [Didymodactylos carnosus]
MEIRHWKKYIFYLCAGILLKILYKYLTHFLPRVNEEELLCPTNAIISNTNNTTKKLILLWTPTFYGDAFQLNNLNSIYKQRICPYSQCEITLNRSQLCLSSAVVFHLRDTFLNDLPPTRKRFQEQRYVLMNYEPPYFSPKIVARMNSFFNWTMTYRRDSDILLDYVNWRNRSSLSQTTKTHYLNDRPSRILWIASNCISDSRREDYIRRLSKIVPTTILGKCRHSLPFLSSSSCNGLSFIDCLKAFSRNHTYYFAFENSFCLDYVTEKYQLQIHLKSMIPIIYDIKQHNNYNRLAIPNSYIDASQFESPESLGEYLNNLTLLAIDAGKSKYDDYFQWTNQYEAVSETLHYNCELCRKLHVDGQTTKIYSDIKKWFFENANCYQWSDKHNQSIKVPLRQTIRFTNRVMDDTLSIASV